MTNPLSAGQMVRGFLAGAFVAAAALVLPAAPASAIEIEGSGLTIAATPALASDYLFRGISQTRSRPALQGTLDIEHESGFYVGAFVSNVAFQGSNAAAELDGLVGYRTELAGIKFDIGAVYYGYPGSYTQGVPELSFFEGVLKASKEIDIVKLMGTFAISPNAFGRSGTGYYVEAGADIQLPFEFIGNLRVGYWNLERNNRFGTPDYVWYSVGVTRELFEGITLTAGWTGTDISKHNCIPTSASPRGQDICGGRFVATLSRAF